jgi:hypothetical protein
MDAAEEEAMPRRFITVEDVDRLVEGGTSQLDVGPDTTITDLARERARERGLALTRTGSDSGAPAVATADRGRVRAEVRAAVIAQLGSEPPQLERIIDRVLDARG